MWMTRWKGRTTDKKKIISTMQDFKNVSKDSKISGKSKATKCRSKKRIDYIIKKFRFKIRGMSMGIFLFNIV